MKRLLVALGLLLVLANPALSQNAAAANPAPLKIDVLDVGQGDAILIRRPEGKTALIDTGPSKKVVDQLRQRSIDHLDLLAVSHHHQDHYGGAIEVVRRLRPRAFLASNSHHTTPNYLRLLEVVHDAGITPVFPTDRTRKITLGTVALTVFPQAPENSDDENNNSVGIRLDYGQFSMLFPGDAEEPERAWWEGNAREQLPATVLKLAHHGSRNGTDARWLAIVRPRIAIGSMGRNNPFGHPHPETVALLERLAIAFYRTDRDGTATITSDGTHWNVVREADVARGPPDRHRKPTMQTERSVPVDRQVNLNTASQADLEALPGIGPTLARRIIAARPFRSVEDLDAVKGIGPKKLAKVRPMVRVE